MIFSRFWAAILAAAGCFIFCAPACAASWNAASGQSQFGAMSHFIAASRREAATGLNAKVASYPKRVAMAIQAHIDRSRVSWGAHAGTVSVKYWIGADGRIDNVRIIAAPTDELAAAALWLLSGMRVPAPPDGWDGDARQNVHFGLSPPRR